MSDQPTRPPIQHENEVASNDWRRRCASVEPRSLRTYTPSLAVIARAEGWHVYTTEDRPLADFSSGVLVANLGHNPTDWWDQVLDYMGLQTADASQRFAKAMPLTSYNTVTPLEVLAAERLLENMRNQPGGARMEQVCWAASGSEAIQKALWCVMRRVPGKDHVLATRHGFHGKKGLAGAVTGTEKDKERDPRVRFIDFPIEASIDLASAHRPPDLTPFERELDQIWEEVGDRLCAVITEPYLGGGGSFHPHPSYLQCLQDYCRRHDLAFILDEIQSCFGRTGPMYAYTKYGLEPDIVCLGKGLGNGIPVSAAVGRRDLIDALDYGECSDTFSGNPLAVAAVIASIDMFENTDVLENVAELSRSIEAGLLRLTETGLVAHVRGEGCVWGIECAEFAGHAASDVANACVLACYEGDEEGRAIHLLGPLAGCVIRISPPLVMPPAEAEKYLDVMFSIFQNVAQSLQAQPATT